MIFLNDFSVASKVLAKLICNNGDFFAVLGELGK
jgi:hypothetical protein